MRTELKKTGAERPVTHVDQLGYDVLIHDPRLEEGMAMNAVEPGRIIDFHAHAFPDAVAEKAMPKLEGEANLKAALDSRRSGRCWRRWTGRGSRSRWWRRSQPSRGSLTPF